MTDLLRLVTLEGPVLGLGMLVALVWLIVTVRGLVSKVSGLDSKVTNLATDVAVLRGRQDERDRQERIEVNRAQLVRAFRDIAAGDG